jgi:hypothetical protein
MRGVPITNSRMPLNVGYFTPWSVLPWVSKEQERPWSNTQSLSAIVASVALR